MSMILGQRKGVASEMNVTPLIDVLLVLLIIFMVVLPHHYFGEKADIPLASGPHVPNSSPIVIQLTDAADGKKPKLWMNQEQIAWEALEPKLRKIYQLRLDKIVFVKGDPDIDFQYVAEVLDLAHHAGVDRVGLMNEKERP